MRMTLRRFYLRITSGLLRFQDIIMGVAGKKRMRIYFIKMQELKDRFRSSIISGSTGRLLSGFLKYQCIIIDEVCISFSGESYRGRGRTSISLDFTNPIIRMGN